MWTINRWTNTTPTAIRWIIIVLLLCGMGTFSYAQYSDSSKLRISLLTCSPGEELYSTFGHTAIRITDSTLQSDLVFNYGTFDFEDPSFYLKFVRGKLLYFLSSESYADFAYYYRMTNRSITEQVLVLDPSEKYALRNALIENLQERNKFYRYDFFFDNCTTRPLGLLKKYRASLPALPDMMPAGTTFRQAIHQYLDQQGMDWSKFGIDLLLASPTDAVMKPGESQFLPENLLKSLDAIQQRQAVYVSRATLAPYQAVAPAALWFTPLKAMIALALFTGGLIWIGHRSTRLQLLATGWENMLWFSMGLLGIVFVFMWTATDHAMCRNNFNLLWAWPTHVIWPFVRQRNANWVRWYRFVYLMVIGITLISWYWLPQQLAIPLIPVLLLLAALMWRDRPSQPIR